MPDVVIIGGGHNGLTAAFYLAKAGKKPLVLERRDTVGGGAITTEIHPGFRCPALTHQTCLHADIAQDMQLERCGVTALTPPVDVFAPGRDGASIVIYPDARRTADSLRSVCAHDADGWPAYRDATRRVCEVIAPLLAQAPPDIDSPDAGDLWSLLKAGRRFRRLGRRDAYRLLRWAPMPVSDLMDEWFESELLRATVAAPALTGTMLGPRSAGSGLLLLLQEAHRMLAARVSRIRGGPGALTGAMARAAHDAGAEIRTGAAVDRIVVKSDRVAAVVVNGESIAASTVLSALDPKTTFLSLVDPSDLSPDFRAKVAHIRARGTTAKVNLALSALPAFPAAPATELLSGRIHIGPSLDYLERAFDHAKYGEMSAQPWLDVTIPSVLEPELAPSGAHVMSIVVHFAPYRLRSADWPSRKQQLLDVVVSTLDRYAPGIRSLVIESQVITPVELESEYGLSGGHIFHGELALDQFFTMRPLLGYARYDSPIRGLYLCGAGAHPGGFMTGASGKLAATAVSRASY